MLQSGGLRRMRTLLISTAPVRMTNHMGYSNLETTRTIVLLPPERLSPGGRGELESRRGAAVNYQRQQLISIPEACEVSVMNVGASRRVQEARCMLHQLQSVLADEPDRSDDLSTEDRRYARVWSKSKRSFFMEAHDALA